MSFDFSLAVFYLQLLRNEHANKWAFLMEFETYVDIMQYFASHYSLYMKKSQFEDPDNKEIYWEDLVEIARDYHEEHVAHTIAMDLYDMIEMTNFCMVADLAVQYRRDRLLLQK